MQQLQGQVVADINVSVKILKQGRAFGYQITLEDSTITGWTNSDGVALQSGIHAWRTAMKRCKDHSRLAPSLLQVTKIM